jgi:type IV secretory pathway VirB10-like protein
MPQSLRARTFSLLTLATLAAVPLAISLVACGGSEPPPVPPPPPPATVEAVPVATVPPPVATDTTAPAPPPPPPAPTSTVATTKTDASWAGCHQSFKAKGKDVAGDVAAMAKGCATVTKMKLVGKTLMGKQGAEDPPQSFPFDAKASHCYRAYAQASEGIKDLDVVVKDSASIVVGQDSTDDPSPVVMEDGVVCFSKDDKAALVVSVGMGKGSYAVQIWSN